MDAEITVTSNVQVWAVSGSCTVNKAVLTNYVHDLSGSTTPADPGDNVPMVSWNSALWGVETTNYTTISPAYNAATGVLTFVATRLEPSAPIGYNGQLDTYNLATLRFKVLDIAANATSPLTCVIEFLDRNGRKVVTTAAYKAPAPLQIVTGYSIKGTVKYQAHSVNTGITVSCTGPSSGSTTTDATGKFSINNLRTFGVFTCTFSGGGALNGRYLDAVTQVDVSQFSFTPPTIPEIVLKGGNTIVQGSPDGVFTEDLTTLTGSYGLTVAKDTLGDTNGDAKVNQSDLAIVASNYTRQETTDARHLIYSLARNTSVFADSNAWLGIVDGNSVTTLLPPAQKKVYWATLSPDGTKLAFVQEMKPYNSITGDLPRYALFTSTVGAATAPARLTPATWNMDAFAPSWSLDGSKIAFVCSKNLGSGADWYTSNPGFGTLCMIDAQGANLINTTRPSELRAPAWITQTTLVYAAALDNLLWKYDLIAATEEALPNIGLAQNATNPIYEDGLLFYESGSYVFVATYDGTSVSLQPPTDMTFGSGYHFQTPLFVT